MNTNNQKKEQSNPERLIDIRELSDLTGMKVSTLYLWSSTSKIPVIRMGKSLRFRYSDVIQTFQDKK